MDYPEHIGMVGTGYVGLITAACFAELGNKVICSDISITKIKKLQKGQPPIYEPELATLIKKNSTSGNLLFFDSLRQTIVNSKIIFIAIGTPALENGDGDISHIENAIRNIAPLLKEYKIIVIKSTVPVGTSRKLGSLIKNLNPEAQFSIVNNPEFLRAGSGIQDFMAPDRIVIGLEDNKALLRMQALYHSFTQQDIPIVYTTLENSELIKYTSNCFLATKVAFANEIADLCEKLNADASEVLYAMGLDKRIGTEYLKPGPGLGGSCLIKDMQALLNTSKKVKSPLRIIEAVLTTNKQRKQKIIETIVAACNHSLQNKNLAILGMSFKANTDDIRESPTLKIILELQSLGANLTVYDPEAKSTNVTSLLNIKWGKNVEETLFNSDAVIIMTEWQEFKELDLHAVKNNFRNTVIPPTLIDFRNLYQPSIVAKEGIRYISIGRAMPETAPILENVVC
jgi:UDPglucose 6-dehydrogenase